MQTNFTDVLPAFMQGEKITTDAWSDKEYIHIVDGRILDEIGVGVSLQVTTLSGKWSLFKEPETWKWKRDINVNGKRITIQCESQYKPEGYWEWDGDWYVGYKPDSNWGWDRNW